MAAENSMRHVDRLVVRPPDGHSGDGRLAGAPHAACMWQCWLMRGVPHGGSRFGCCCHDIVCCCELLLGAVAATARVCCCDELLLVVCCWDELLLVVVAATAHDIAVTSYCSRLLLGRATARRGRGYCSRHRCDEPLLAFAAYPSCTCHVTHIIEILSAKGASCNTLLTRLIVVIVPLIVVMQL